MRGVHSRCLLIVFCLAAAAQHAIAADEPVIVGDQLVFPADENAVIPRSLTDTERRWLETHPLGGNLRGTTAAPTGPVRCVAEYEPMDGILISWKSFTTAHGFMGAKITNEGDANLYVMVDTVTQQNSATTALTNAGANMARVQFFRRTDSATTTNTVWIRDYGPRYIYQGQCRAITDHQYNRPRPIDDVLPSYFAAFKHHAFYEHAIIHGGGNMHLDALNHSFVTRLVTNENSGSLTETQIHDIWSDFQAIDTHFFDPYPTSVDSTQHIDMWMQIIADDKVIISDWPSNAGSAQDIVCDDAAVFMASQGYTVYRTPARSLSGVHYTYTNMVMCNNIVLLPSYSNTTMSSGGASSHNSQALATLQAALPGKTIIQVPNCDSIAASAGVIHCIVMHLPKHLGAAGPNGGLSPTAYLKNLRGGDVLAPAALQDILWISDDDVAVSNVDILLSTDSGATYDSVLASATADDGAFTWTTPGFYTPHARIKVVARDALGNVGSDESPADFTINGIPALGDMNCNGAATLDDVEPFVHVLLQDGLYTGCNAGNADVNQDGQADSLDVATFVALLLP